MSCSSEARERQETRAPCDHRSKMSPLENYTALLRHAQGVGDWSLTGSVARFLEQEPSRSMIAACCSYITLCERLGIDDRPD